MSEKSIPNNPLWFIQLGLNKSTWTNPISGFACYNRSTVVQYVMMHSNRTCKLRMLPPGRHSQWWLLCQNSGAFERDQASLKFDSRHESCERLVRAGVVYGWPKKVPNTILYECRSKWTSQGHSTDMFMVALSEEVTFEWKRRCRCRKRIFNMVQRYRVG